MRLVKILRLSKIACFVLIWVIFVPTISLYLGINNSYDNIAATITSDDITDVVKVYRASDNTPTIIGKTIADVIFGQGYEFARDRTWQLEFTRSVTNGELSRLFGRDFVDSDKFLRTIGLKSSAESTYERMKVDDPLGITYIESYVRGINTYFRLHESSPPEELVLLGRSPKEWSVIDVLAVQGLMAYDLAWSGLSRELNMQELFNAVNASTAVEILDFQNPDVISYLKNFTFSKTTVSTTQYNPLRGLLGSQGFNSGIGSNNWVIHGNLTKSGKPLFANDPHLGLTTPSIWWKIHLIATEESLNIEGFALPGIPFITIGHNENVVWGITIAGTDAVDLFYLNMNETHYLVGEIWYQIEKIPQTITLENGETINFDINKTMFGPLLDINGTTYAISWVLNQNYESDLIFKTLRLLSIAKNVDEVHDALEFFSTPGSNFVFADVSGNIGYQYTGVAPIRKSGFGIFPKNASTGEFGWDGFEPYSKHLYVKNPEKGYFQTANQRIDTSNTFYISEDYSTGYRAKRIESLLSSKSRFTVSDIIAYQNDIYNIATLEFLDPVYSSIKANYAPEDSYKNIVTSLFTELDSWNKEMAIDSISASFFAVYHNFFVYETIRDELGEDVANSNVYDAHIKVGNWTQNEQTNKWFDDSRTTGVETAKEIAVRAFDKSLRYLIDNFGRDINQWKWGMIHQVTFSHTLGGQLPFFNSDTKPSSGSYFTLNAGGAPSWSSPQDISFSQSEGPSFRLIANVTTDWEGTQGIVPIGSVGSLSSPQRSDLYEAWLSGAYISWNFDRETTEATHKLHTTFRRPS